MARGSGICLTLLLTGVLSCPCMLEANPAPEPLAGGTVAARSPHKTIRMEAEEVTIRLGKGTYAVEGVYHMFNSGEATTEWVDFPKGREREMPDGWDYPNFIQFHAWVDGKKVPFTKDRREWLAGQVTFPGHATTIIRVVYEVNYPVVAVYGGDYAEYIVGTGSLWKDSIGKALFTVDGSEIGGTEYFDAELKAPRSHKLRSEHVVRIEVSDFKPQRDATLFIKIKDQRKAAEK
ncbi:MAG: hypothetical protein AB1646_10000 [Thermodesulfobacteriota bacterium]